MAKKKKLRQVVSDPTAKSDGQPNPSEKVDLPSRKEKGKHLDSPAITKPTKESPIDNQKVREKVGQSSKSAVQRQPSGDKNKIQLQMKKKPAKALQESTGKDSPSVFKKKIRDPKLIPRMREYLDSRTKKNIVSIPLMAEYLQNKYPEYSRRKRSVFTMYIDRAYTILDKQPRMACSSSSSSDFSDDDDADGNDHRPIDGKPRVKRRKVLKYNDEADSVEEEEEVLMEYKDTNSINNMMSSMYKSSSQHAAENQRVDANGENSLIAGNGNANSNRLGSTTKDTNDCYFIDKKGDNQGKAKSKPSSSASNSRDATIQKFMGGLPVRNTPLTDGSALKDPRLSAKNLNKRLYNESDSDSQIRSHGGITQNNTGISVEAPSSPTAEDQFGDRIAAPIVIESDREDTSLIMEANTSRGDVDDAVKEMETLTPKRSRKQKVASKSKKNKDEKAETGSKEAGPALQKSTVTFSDIGGNEQSLIEICKLLVHMRHPEVYQQLGVTPPRGFLLHGPPGCGKTLLANAIAGELDLPLLKIAATEIVSGVSGDSEEKVRELFEKATQSAPCILFIDEVDAITPKRETASKDMERRIVSQLLTCMDDLNANVEAHVLVIGATNRPDSLDPALRRAGRFDKEICLGIPDEMSRKRILEVLCRSLRLTQDFDFSYLAKFTPGYVGADLMSLTREAAMVAVNRVFKDLQTANPAKQTSEIVCNGQTIHHGDSFGKEVVMDTSENLETGAMPPKSESISVITDSYGVKKSDFVNNAVNQSDNENSSLKDPRTENRTVNQPNGDNSAVTNSDSLVPLPSNHSMDTSCSTGPIVQSSIDSAEKLHNQISESIVDLVVTSEVNDVISSAQNTSGIQPGEEVISKDKMQDPESKELASVLSWLKDTPPLTEDQLRDLFVNLEDFKIALKSVQPSAKREGFATVPDVTWDDIGALHDVREELQLAILAPVRHPEEFKALGLNRAQGILLAGPPGCGKTLLAKAVANESGINFISVKGPELLNMYVGESEKAVRTVFQRARNSSPCVIFFDELDALCPRRSGAADGGSSTRVVNQLLTEMDGLEERKQVFIMAATNRPDIIDPAVLRPGRLDKTLYVGLPSLTDRLDILRCLTKNGTQPHLSSDVDMSVIAGDQRCENYTGADIAALVREASVTALKEAISNIKRPAGTLIEVACGHFETAFRKIKPSVSEKDRDCYMNMGKKLTTD